MNNLKELTLTKNKLKDLKRYEFTDLRSLECLNLEMNKINEMSSPFDNLIHLKKIQLGDNELKTIDKNLFVNNTNLEFLSLRANEIIMLHFKTFFTLSKLREIDLSLNQLKSIDSKLFEKNFNVQKLDLSYNSLQEIDANFFEPLVSLDKIDFDGNPCFNEAPNGNIQSLNETIAANCTVTDKTRVEWLNELVLELKVKIEKYDSKFTQNVSNEKTRNLETKNQSLIQELSVKNAVNFNFFDSTECIPKVETLQNELNFCEEEKEAIKKENTNLEEKLRSWTKKEVGHQNT